MAYKQLVTPNINIGASLGYCLGYVDNALNAPNRSDTAQIAYNTAVSKGWIRNNTDFPRNVWFILFWSLNNGSLAGYGHVALAYVDGNGNMQIHDSEVHSGAYPNRPAYGSLAEIKNWFASGGISITYLGWSVGVDGVVLIQDTAIADINKASLDGFKYSNGKVYASGWHIANYKYEYIIFINADNGKEITRVKASPVSRPDVKKAYNVDGAENSGFSVSASISPETRVQILARATNSANGNSDYKDVLFGQIIDNRIEINSHTEKIGWKVGKTAGSTGKGLRLEAVVVPDGVESEAHIQDKGWTSRRTSGEIIGTAGKSLRLEAVKFYGNIKYRVHIQNIGWTGWMSSGKVAGTTGKGLRIEAIEIVRIG